MNPPTKTRSPKTNFTVPASPFKINKGTSHHRRDSWTTILPQTQTTLLTIYIKIATQNRTNISCCRFQQRMFHNSMITMKRITSLTNCSKCQNEYPYTLTFTKPNEAKTRSRKTQGNKLQKIMGQTRTHRTIKLCIQVD